MIAQRSVKTLLKKQKQRDDWFLSSYSLNPYYGCPNCVYCYLRGSAYGARMSTEPTVKINAPDVLERELAKYARRSAFGFITMDAYPPFEEEIALSRRLLEIIKFYRFPVHILTKSTLVTRDLALLGDIRARAIVPPDLEGRVDGAIVSFSFSTVDAEVAARFEPNAPPPDKRLAAMQACADAGLHTGVLGMPLLPYISDTDDALDDLIRQAKAHGASYFLGSSLTLFGDGGEDCRARTFRVLNEHYPDLTARYEALFPAGATAPPRAYTDAAMNRIRRACKRNEMKASII